MTIAKSKIGIFAGQNLPKAIHSRAMKSVFAILALSSAFLGVVEAQQKTLKADLDPFINLRQTYKLTPDDLPKLFEQGSWNRNPYFKYLTQDKSRAIFQNKNSPNLKLELSMLGGTVPVEELIVDFDKNGQFLGITVSIFNRGDGGTIGADDFEKRKMAMGRHIGEQLQSRPTAKKAMPSQGLLTEGFVWLSTIGKAVLEWNDGAPGNTEFLRMRIARRHAQGAYEAATQTRAAASVKLSQLPANVAKDSKGNVFVSDIPMVDQGSKGYCVVASVQRLFEYYGIACDMHQLAQIAGSDPEEGTSTLKINASLGAIDHLFKTRFTCMAVKHKNGFVELKDNKYVGDKIDNDKVVKMVRKSVDEGVPVLWSLELGLHPEEPDVSPQTSGGHMRMIIGYNDREDKLIFSDSWGAGHEFKTMNLDYALDATRGLFLLKPTTR